MKADEGTYPVTTATTGTTTTTNNNNTITKELLFLLPTPANIRQYH
jgi:hypothetical protein